MDKAMRGSCLWSASCSEVSRRVHPCCTRGCAEIEPWGGSAADAGCPCCLAGGGRCRTPANHTGQPLAELREYAR